MDHMLQVPFRLSSLREPFPYPVNPNPLETPLHALSSPAKRQHRLHLRQIFQARETISSPLPLNCVPVRKRRVQQLLLRYPRTSNGGKTHNGNRSKGFKKMRGSRSKMNVQGRYASINSKRRRKHASASNKGRQTDHHWLLPSRRLQQRRQALSRLLDLLGQPSARHLSFPYRRRRRFRSNSRRSLLSRRLGSLLPLLPLRNPRRRRSALAP